MKWKTVQLPEDLLERVDKVVGQGSIGYSSRAEFIKEAVRLRLEEVEKKLPLPARKGARKGGRQG